ncbi:MAG TPA: M28 family peptidase [Thermodesulfobacteriota bacterium]|nr:M28 family peptidase [Thermodesulfobacteriota bacterium]
MIDLEPDGSGALSYTREFSFPRRTGTKGESKAAQAIVRTLKELGYETVEEEFSIHPSPWVWMKGGHLLTIFFLLTIWLTYEKIPFIAFLFSTLYLVGLGVWDRIWISMGRWLVSEDLSRGIRSMNISAHLPGKQEGQPLYLMAHYDSKSQSLNLYLRTGLFLFGTLSGVLFCLGVWVHVPILFQVFFFLSMTIHVVLICSRMGNQSEGALDNASGVGSLLQVARVWASRATRGVDLRFIFTGAEEMGLLGSLMFQKRRRKRMVLEEAFLINIDSVGKKGKMRVCSSGEAGGRWLKEVVAFAREKGIDLRPLRFHQGIMMDHLPFSHLGIASLSLTSISTEGWHVHTPRDTFSRVQPGGLAEMERLVLALIESMATRASSPSALSSPP